MNEILEKIFGLPTKTKLVVAVIILSLPVALYFFIFAKEISEETDKLYQSINAPKTGLKAKIAELEGIRRNMDRFTQESGRLQEELAYAKSELPDRTEIASLLAKISDKAQDVGLEVKSFKPQTEIKHDYYAEQPVSIEVVGSYHEIAAFFDEVGRLPRIVNLDSFQIKEPSVGDDEVVATSSVVATTYRFLDDNERSPQSDKSPKSASRRK